MTQDTPITTEARGHVFLIGLNRPKKLNAFSVQMLHELAQAFTHFEDTPDLRCAVLFAHGDHFTAGLDLAEVGPHVASGSPLFPEDGVDPFGLFGGRTRTKPVVCALKGYCFTIGIELALACDIRVAATSCKIAQIEIKRGIMPFGGATLRWPLISGWGNAMRYLLTGDEFGAEEALRIGLAQEIAEPDAVDARAIELAETIAKQAPLGVYATLASARRAVNEGPEAAADGLIDEARKLMASEDAREGLMSFTERREANFQGK